MLRPPDRFSGVTNHSNIDLVGLRYFVATAEAGAFACAARSLDLNTSTVSRRIARLEDDLGLTLFERGRSGARLTAAGKSVMPHVRRALAELDVVKRTAKENGSGHVGEIRVGVRMPPVGEPLSGLLKRRHEIYPKVAITIVELCDRDIVRALEERRLDVAFIPSYALWPHAAALPMYREGLVVALPIDHPLAGLDVLDWASLADETFLVQGWDDSQVQRDFFASLMGSGTGFRVHPASKQSILSLVVVGFGITLATRSQSEVSFPGLAFIQISEPNAWFRVDLAWMPETEEPAVGRFVAFMRDEARLRNLLRGPPFPT